MELLVVQQLSTIFYIHAQDGNAVISGSSISTGSFGSITTPGRMTVGAQLTVAELSQFSSTMQFVGSQTIETSGGSDNLTIAPQANLNLGTTSTDNIIIGASSRNTTINSTTTTINNTLAAATITGTTLTTTGNISGSSTSTGSFGAGFFGGNVNIDTGKNLIFSPSVYTSAVQGIKFDQDGGTTDAIIQAARISGNLGIVLYLGSNTFVNTSGGNDRYNDSEESAGIEVRHDGQIRFLTNTNAADPLSRMAINSDGTVGIGTDDPA